MKIISSDSKIRVDSVRHSTWGWCHLAVGIDVEVGRPDCVNRPRHITAWEDLVRVCT